MASEYMSKETEFIARLLMTAMKAEILTNIRCPNLEEMAEDET